MVAFMLLLHVRARAHTTVIARRLLLASANRYKYTLD